MSEFSVIIELVGKAVKCLFDITVDILCVCAYLVSCLLPWRLVENIYHYNYAERHHYDSRGSCREQACGSLFLTLVDCIILPVSSLAFLSPLRWRSIKHAIKVYNLTTNINNIIEFRLSMGQAAIGGAFDLFCYISSCITLISPVGRQIVIFPSVYSAIRFTRIASEDPTYFEEDTYFERLWEIDVCLAYNALLSLVDLLLMPCAILCICIPTRWRELFSGLALIKSKHTQELANRRDNNHFNNNNNNNNTEPPQALQVPMNFWDIIKLIKDQTNLLEYYQLLIFIVGILAWVDVFLWPFYIFAYISPFKHKSFVEKSSALHVSHWAELEKDRCAAESVSEDIVNWERRLHWFQTGLLALSDLFLLPLLLPLYATQYRYRAIKDELFSAGKWGVQEFCLISSQTSLLFCDIIFLLPWLPLLYVTRFRWSGKMLHKWLAKPDVFRHHSFSLYKAVLVQVALLLADILVLPFALILLITWYRSKTARTIAWGRVSASFLELREQQESAQALRPDQQQQDLAADFGPSFVSAMTLSPVESRPKSLRDRAGFRLHANVLMNFLVMLHDMLLFVACCLLAVLSPRRLYVVYIICRHMFKYHCRDDDTGGGDEKKGFTAHILRAMQAEVTVVEEEGQGSAKVVARGKLNNHVQKVEDRDSASPPFVYSEVSHTSLNTSLLDAQQISLSISEQMSVREKGGGGEGGALVTKKTTTDNSNAVSRQRRFWALVDWYEERLISFNTSFYTRKKLWMEFLLSFCDFFCNIMAIFVAVTLWRLWQLVDELRACLQKVEPERLEALQSAKHKSVPTWEEARVESNNRSTAININTADLGYDYYDSNTTQSWSTWRQYESLERDAALVRRQWDKEHLRGLLAKFDEYFESLDGVIVVQFVKLWRDIIFLIPMGIITACVYRLPLLVKALVMLFCSDAGSDHSIPLSQSKSPLFDVQNCHFEFPDTGGPRISMRLKRSNLPASLCGISPDEKVHLVAARHVRMHVVGSAFWQTMVSVFGSMLVNVARSFLPLLLIDKKYSNLGEFSAALLLQRKEEEASEASEAAIGMNASAGTGALHVDDAEKALYSIAVGSNEDDGEEVVVAASRSGSGSEGKGADSANAMTDSGTASLWINIDIGATKKSTVAKKLKLIPAEEKIALQFEVTVQYEANPPAAASSISYYSQQQQQRQTLVERKVVLCRLVFTAGELLAVCIQGQGELPVSPPSSWLTTKKTNCCARVQAKYRSSSDYFPGTIKHDWGDGTFHVEYDDGKFEVRVQATDIRFMSATETAAAAAATATETAATATATVCDTSFCDEAAIAATISSDSALRDKEHENYNTTNVQVIREEDTRAKQAEGAASSSGSATSFDEPSVSKVDRFHVVVGQHFLSLLEDIWSLRLLLKAMAYLLLAVCTILSPIRFLKLVVVLFEHEGYLPLRLAQSCLGSVSNADKLIQSYRKLAAPIMNSCTKVLVAMNLSSGTGVTAAARTGGNNNNNNTAAAAVDPAQFYRGMGIGNGNYQYAYGYESNAISDDQKEALQVIEDSYLSPYNSLCKNVSKVMTSFAGCGAGTCGSFLALWDQRQGLHIELMKQWYLKYATTCVLGTSLGSNKFGMVSAMLSSDAMAVAQALAANSQQLQATVRDLEADVAQQVADLKAGIRVDPITGNRTIKKKAWPIRVYRGCGLCTRPSKASYMLIKLHIMQAVADVGFTLLLLFFLLNPLTCFSLVGELRALGQCNPMRYGTRAVLIRLVGQAKRTCIQAARLFFFVICILITVGGIPRFLQQIFDEKPSNLKQAADIAKHHAQRFCVAIGNVLCLVFAFRTYRLTFKAVMYAVMVPGACLSEASPLRALCGKDGCSVQLRLCLGLLCWAGLLGGALYVSHLADNAEDKEDEVSSAMFTLCMCLVGVLLVSALSLSPRTEYTQCDPSASKTRQLTWSHLLAALTGPMEALQLSAVVMYFHWATEPHSPSSASSSNSASSAAYGLGVDSFSSSALLWNYGHGGEQGYYVAASVACLLVMLWILLVSIPMAMSGDRHDAHHMAKVATFKSSAAYEYVTLLISRLLPVWIIATLMRSSSCISAVSDSNNNDDNEYVSSGLSYVMSTATNTACGASHGHGQVWVAMASMPLLAFFVITGSVLHADDAALLRMEQVEATAAVRENRNRHYYSSYYWRRRRYWYWLNNRQQNELERAHDESQCNEQMAAQSVVKFSPLYSLLASTVHLLVCVLSFGIFAGSNRNDDDHDNKQAAFKVLLPIIVACVTLAGIPLLSSCYYYCSSGDGDEEGGGGRRRGLQCCSWGSVTPIRSAGFLCVAFTAFCCMKRNLSANKDGISQNDIFSREMSVFIGWGVIYGLSLLMAVWMEWRHAVRWRRRLAESDLPAAVQSLLVSFKELLVNDADDIIRNNAVKSTVSDSTLASASSPVSKTDIGSTRPVVAKEPCIYSGQFSGGASGARAAILRKLERAGSWTDLAVLVLQLESLILTERLSVAFMQRRGIWAQQLLEITDTADEALISAVDEASSYGINGDNRVGASSTVLQKIVRAVQELQSSLRPVPPITTVGKQTMLCLLNRRLPVELCWEVNSYLMHATEMRRTFKMDATQLRADWRMRHPVPAPDDNNSNSNSNSAVTRRRWAESEAELSYPGGNWITNGGKFDVVLSSTDAKASGEWSITSRNFDRALSFVIERLWRFRDASTSMTLDGESSDSTSATRAGGAGAGAGEVVVDVDQYFDRFHPGLLYELDRRQQQATTEDRTTLNNHSQQQPLQLTHGELLLQGQQDAGGGGGAAGDRNAEPPSQMQRGRVDSSDSVDDALLALAIAESRDLRSRSL